MTADSWIAVVEQPVRYGWTYRAVPLTGREVWLRWPANARADTQEEGPLIDGPYPALCLLMRVPVGMADAKSSFLTDTKGQRTPYLELNERLSVEVEQELEYMGAWVTIAGPPTWENFFFELGTSAPEVWWRLPPLDEAKDE